MNEDGDNLEQASQRAYLEGKVSLETLEPVVSITVNGVLAANDALYLASQIVQVATGAVMDSHLAEYYLARGKSMDEVRELIEGFVEFRRVRGSAQPGDHSNMKM